MPRRAIQIVRFCSNRPCTPLPHRLFNQVRQHCKGSITGFAFRFQIGLEKPYEFARAYVYARETLRSAFEVSSMLAVSRIQRVAIFWELQICGLRRMLEAGFSERIPHKIGVAHTGVANEAKRSPSRQLIKQQSEHFSLFKAIHVFRENRATQV